MVQVRPAARRLPWGRWTLTGGTLGWFALLVLFPVGALVVEAFQAGPLAFLQGLQGEAAAKAFRLTLWTTILAVAINTVMGLALAVLLVRHKFPGKTLFDGIVDLPFAVSPVVAGFMFIVLFGPQGILGRWFEAGGVKIIFALPGIVFATLFVTLPFVTREVVPVLREMGREPEEVAATLGAGRWLTFWRVTLPTIRWGLIYGITLTTARALGEFGAVLVVSGNIIKRTQTATLHIHQEFTDFNYQGAFSASLVLGGISFVLLLLTELWKKRQEKR
ncbi:MAG: sulfate ABC transporter permease [Candidatus Zixiibacteriota bacterium]|nr:MAG: sulfate ABC transporter permease [candidate division Zixibacteria bacterium]